MRFLNYTNPQIEIDVWSQGRLAMTISDEKATVVTFQLSSKNMGLVVQAIIAAKARMHPNEPGKGVLHFPPK